MGIFDQDCVDIGVVGFRIDAAKHMWPDDIKGTIDRVGDLPEGGRPFFVHEVIDQGGEPIKVQEYFGVGRTTEFRYGIKVTIQKFANEHGAMCYYPRLLTVLEEIILEGWVGFMTRVGAWLIQNMPWCSWIIMTIREAMGVQGLC